MGIPNVKRYSIAHPETGDRAVIAAVLPKGSDVNAYLADATKRFDWKAWDEQQASRNKVRAGQQKQVRRR